MEHANQKRPKRREFIVQFVLGAALLLLCLAAGSYVLERYKQFVPPRQDGNQESYERLPELLTRDSHPLLYWAELGANNSLVSVRFARDEGVSVELTGFRIGAPWHRRIKWHVTGNEKASIELTFPPRHISHVALYMTDGDSYWRNSRLVSSGEQQIATELHDGRWIVFKVQPEEAVRGRKSIEIYQLTGSSISVSAIGAFGHPGR